ncbi:unnamed protein product [Bursaphelenchus xylophilus]|nr:unnamed protein product [Bursaphelenchus xylophilus]CAG9118541.1 unnamed protein product [Bursaphelenchus xylophilus]
MSYFRSVSATNLAIGGLIGVLSFSSIALNISVMITLKTKGFLSTKKSTAYSISFAYIFADILEQAVILFYAAPSIITQSYLVPSRDHPVVTAAGIWFMVFWYMAMFYQIVISIDRVNSIVFQRSWIREYYRLIISLVWIFSLGTAYIGFFVSPCCHFVVSYVNYAFTYLEGENYTDSYLDIPFNLVTTVTIFVCYTWIFLHVRRSNRINNVPRNKLAERRQQEFLLARQFFIMAMLFTSVWVSFRILPRIFPPNSPLLALVPITLSFHCSFNSIVFLSINSEFQQAYRQVLRGKISTSTSNPQNSAVTA